MLHHIRRLDYNNYENSTKIPPSPFFWEKYDRFNLTYFTLIYVPNIYLYQIIIYYMVYSLLEAG